MIVRPLFYDINGKLMSPQFHSGSQGGGTAIAAQMDTVSSAGVQVVRFTTVTAPNSAPTSGAYASVYDAMELVFKSQAPRSRVRILVPAPLQGVFLADQETVNPAAIGALLGTILANGTDPAGNPLEEFLGGVRRRLTPAR